METLIVSLLALLILVESNGDDKAIGDNGKAKGCLQIHKIYVDDVNRIYGTKFTHDDCFDRAKAMEITKLYLLHYGKHYEKKTGKKVTLESLSRIHNGGLNGWKKEATLKYWLKVKALL